MICPVEFMNVFRHKKDEGCIATFSADVCASGGSATTRAIMVRENANGIGSGRFGIKLSM